MSSLNTDFKQHASLSAISKGRAGVVFEGVSRIWGLRGCKKIIFLPGYMGGQRLPFKSYEAFYISLVQAGSQAGKFNSATGLMPRLWGATEDSILSSDT